MALTLVCLLGAGPVSAGIEVIKGQGVVMTGADGVVMTGADGVVMTGADGPLTYGVNGVVMTGADGVVMTGADSMTYPGVNSFRATSADGVVMTGADGVVMTGADGVVMTGADGTTYHVASVTIREADGVVMTGADGVVMNGVNGFDRTGDDGVVMTGADGVVMTGADRFALTTAREVVVTGMDGKVFRVVPDGVVMTGADGVVMTGADGIRMTGVMGVVMTGADGVVMTGADASDKIGLQSFDPELALMLMQATDDSNLSVVVTYHDAVTDADIVDLQQLGIQGGTRFRRLPMVALSATPGQLETLSKSPRVRSMDRNRTFEWSADTRRETTGVTRLRKDTDVTRRNGGVPVSGRGVTVAVLDTGLDSTHADLTGRVARNVKLVDAQGLNPVGFVNPVAVEGVANTDQAYGHGTFVGGIIAGSGQMSGGQFMGVAPGANLLGLSAGDANLFFVLSGLDYLLERGAVNGVRVVNCSFSANDDFNWNDPVNIATKMLTDAGISVVFSAGNSGPGPHTLNPYAVVPWVISVGATDNAGRLADFSARGDFGNSLFRPTLVAPGVDVVSVRSGLSPATGVLGVTLGNDAQQLTPAQIPFYTTASGTSFSAPQVAGTIALMLEANPALTPVQIRDILQRTATPLPNYYQHEVGTGMLNAHAAVLEAAFPSRRMGAWRATLDQGQVEFIKDPAQPFEGTVLPGSPQNAAISIPAGALMADVHIAWGGVTSVNDLGMSVYDPHNTRQAHVNRLNLPGLTGRRESVSFRNPAAGSWRVQSWNALGFAGTSQTYTGLLEVTRATYEVKDIDSLNAASRNDIQRALRSFVMWPMGAYFYPQFSVTRADLAGALVRAGRAPQYMPGQPTYTDVTDATTMNYVESVQSAPGGAFFPKVQAGGQFRPDELVDRTTAAVVLVRAAGLRHEAEGLYAGVVPEVSDALEIPSEFHGYVTVARMRGLLTDNGVFFQPRRALTRAELAHGLAVIMTRTAAQN